jgi:beta-lactamase class D
MKYITPFFLLLLVSCSGLKYLERKATLLDLKSQYDAVGATGTFLLHDCVKNQYFVYNQGNADSLYSPASTFKIVNSIIAMETGVVAKITDTTKWDGVIRDVKEWNKDTDMKSAFKNSTVWYYQSIAKKIGVVKMKKWLDSLSYGANSEIKTIDKFWLNGELKISPQQQLEFLERLANKQLPISSATYEALEDIMLRDVRGTDLLFGKTGWGFSTKDIGWFVGYVRTREGVYTFVNFMLAPNADQTKFPSARINIAYNVLRNQGIIAL